MNRFDIINRIGDKYRVGNTETGEFSYAQALKSVGKDIKDYQKATTGTQHKFLDLRFENERLAVLVECKNKFSRWDKAKIQPFPAGAMSLALGGSFLGSCFIQKKRLIVKSSWTLE